MRSARSPESRSPEAPTALAIETAAAACSVAVCRGERVLAAESVAMLRGHAEALLPMIAQVLEAGGVDRRRLDLIAVTIGPGAFTGLRVGLATARGLALAAAIPCYGVSTLEVLAAAAGDESRAGDRLRLAVLDTRRGDVYAAAWTAGGEALAGPVVLAVDQIAGWLPPGPVLVAGDVAATVAAALTAGGREAAVAAGTGVIDPVRVAQRALHRWLAGERPTVPPAPLYLRAPEAVPAVAGGRRRP